MDNELIIIYVNTNILFYELFYLTHQKFLNLILFNNFNFVGNWVFLTKFFFKYCKYSFDINSYVSILSHRPLRKGAS